MRRVKTSRGVSCKYLELRGKSQGRRKDWKGHMERELIETKGSSERWGRLSGCRVGSLGEVKGQHFAWNCEQKWGIIRRKETPWGEGRCGTFWLASVSLAKQEMRYSAGIERTRGLKRVEKCGILSARRYQEKRDALPRKVNGRNAHCRQQWSLVFPNFWKSKRSLQVCEWCQQVLLCSCNSPSSGCHCIYTLSWYRQHFRDVWAPPVFKFCKPRTRRAE